MSPWTCLERKEFFKEKENALGQRLVSTYKKTEKEYIKVNATPLFFIIDLTDSSF